MKRVFDSQLGFVLVGAFLLLAFSAVTSQAQITRGTISGTVRDVNNLSLLAPNAFTAPGSTGISVNGQRARNDNFSIDGSDNNDISVTVATVPVVPEAVQEFRLQTNPYSVEFGRNSGAQIDVITRSWKRLPRRGL